MAITFTPTAISSGEGVQYSYPFDQDRGLPGQLANLTDYNVIPGNNETGAVLAFGIPLAVNGGGVLRYSCQAASAAGAILGISLRSQIHEKTGQPLPGAAPSYVEGIPAQKPVNILTRGCVYLEVMEAVAVGDALRYHKSGANAGKWGTAASAGNTLALAAGGWAIRKAGAVGRVLMLEINTPAQLSFTADT